jgi:hypothetical protein
VPVTVMAQYGSNAAAIDARTHPYVCPREGLVFGLSKPHTRMCQDRAGLALTDCGSEGRGFESRRSPYLVPYR